jgi:branched-chain amino acid transport system permease protein
MKTLGLTRDFGSLPGGLPGAIGGSLVACAVITAVAWTAISGGGMREIVLIFGINAIMVIGYQVFVGNTGIVSFGHVAFMALGAYAGGIAAIPVQDKALILPNLPSFLATMELPAVPAVLLGGMVAALVALVSGIALMRLSGDAASIATLGLLIIVTNVIGQSTSITKGPQSLYGVPAFSDFQSVFTALGLVVVVSGIFKWSRLGLRARAVRDEETAAELAGVPVLPGRIAAFVVSAFITGVGGAFYGMLLTAFSPSSFFIPQLVIVLTMAVIGGLGSITGALLGASVVTIFNELLRQLESGVEIFGQAIRMPTGASAAGLGLALMTMMLLRPQGLVGSSELAVVAGRQRVERYMTTLRGRKSRGS